MPPDSEPRKAQKDGERGVPSQHEHAFEPRDEWWSLCKVCRLASAAHAESAVDLAVGVDRDFGEPVEA